jgi:hypothetical protein
MINAWKQLALRSLALKRLNFWYFSRKKGYLPDWKAIISADKEFWDTAVKKAGSGPDVLVATNTGGHLPAMNLEGLLTAALTLRGAQVHVLLCDELLPACLLCSIGLYPDMKQFVRHGPSRDACKGCYQPAVKMYRSFGLTVHRLSELISPEDRQKAETLSATLPLADIGKYQDEGIAVGEHAMAGALRFYARGTLAGEPDAEAVLRRYLKASLLTTYATRRLLKQTKFECAVFHHGIYVPQGLVGEVCRKTRVRVVNWNPAYRKTCFVFSHGDTYHHSLMSEPVSRWENLPWTPPMESELMAYLKSRWQGTNDWIWYHERPQEDLKDISRQIGVDFGKPCIGLLTNVVWDAQLHYPANAFPDMLTWLHQTIDYFSRRPELQLLIRVHPAEIRGTVPSRQLVVDEIHRDFPRLPPNVFVIPPENPASTYAAMMACNAVIIYGTKTGVELTSLGMPVIVAGEAWVRNKGITLDVSSAADYYKLLDTLPLKQPLDEPSVRRARKYAYHFFFRRMIPVEFMQPTGDSSTYKMRLGRLKELLPGNSRGLDIICEGILKGTDFIYPAENWTESVP